MLIARISAAMLMLLASVVAAQADFVAGCPKFPATPEGYQAIKVGLPPDLRGKEAKIELFVEIDLVNDGCNHYYIPGRFKGMPSCGLQAGAAYKFESDGPEQGSKSVRHTLMFCPNAKPMRGVARSESLVFNATPLQAVYFPKEYRLKVLLWQPSRESPVTQGLDRSDTEPQKIEVTPGSTF
jgi:hypothetical protein